MKRSSEPDGQQSACRQSDRSQGNGGHLPFRLSALCIPLLAGCGQAPLSALHPASGQAGHIANVWQVMAWGSLLILLIMLTLVFLAVSSRSKVRRRHSFWLLLGGGVLFPVSVMAALLAYTYLGAPPAADAQFRVRVMAQQWHWQVSYPDASGGARHSINVIHIPRGVPTLIELQASDVIHSFWVPRLGGKMDAIPGRINRLVYTADEPGAYHGQCAEYCGVGHAAMQFQLIAHEPDQLEQVLASLPTDQQGAP